MIRFLILCTIFFLTYLGFSALREFDYNLNFLIFNYQIETTIFAIGAIFVASQLILMIFLKIIFLFFDLPSIIRQSLYRRKQKTLNKKLLQVISELLMSNREKALDFMVRVIPDLDKNNQDMANLIYAENEQSFDQKIQYFRTLINKKNYSIYASKKLAEILYNNMHYNEAEEYALKAFNEDDTDVGLMLILIQIYAKLGKWPKLVFIIAKLQRSNTKLLEEKADEMAHYYYTAAQSSLGAGDDAEAIKLLESALTLKPDYIEALNLFTELNINMNNTALILKILKAAFSAKPCFEIAEMYAKCSRSSPEAIYETLASITKPTEYSSLFLAIAAYLGLDDKVREFKLPKLINYDERSNLKS